MASTTDGDGETTTYSYNYLGQQVTTTDPDSRVSTDGYDAVGDLTSVQQPGGSCSASPKTGCITYAYDADGNQTGITYSDGTHGVTYSYDADNRRISMTDGTGTSTWTYDSLGRLTASTDGAGNHLAYGYDLDGDQTSLTYPGGDTVTRTFDADGRMASVTDWDSDTTNFSYDADSNLVAETLPSATGETDTYTYDDADRLTGITYGGSSAPLASITDTLDANGQVTAEASTGLGGTDQTYTYNSLSQLSGADSATYAYDAAGNPTELASGATQAFDPASELCWTSPSGASGTCSSAPSDATTYTYNANGDRTSATPAGGTAVTYTYDQANELTSYDGTEAYAYDGDGLRVSKTPSGGSAEDFVWDQSSNPPEVLVDGSTDFVYGPDGLPLEQINSSGVLWLHHDQIGSTRVITDSSGTVVGTADYSPYGQVTASSGTKPVLGFAGGYTDPESGLIYLVNRYYDPATAQFLSVDPDVGLTAEPYLYVADDPVNGGDPTGLWCLIHNSAGGCLGAGIVRQVAETAQVSVQAAGIIAAGVSALSADIEAACTDAGQVECAAAAKLVSATASLTSTAATVEEATYDCISEGAESAACISAGGAAVVSLMNSLTSLVSDPFTSALLANANFGATVAELHDRFARGRGIPSFGGGTTTPEFCPLQ